MTKTLKDLSIILAVTVVLILIVWLPHLMSLRNFYNLNFSNGFNTIYRNYDGLEYIVIAKSFYEPKLITQLPQSMATTYYASHFPLYSIMILFFSPLLGFLKSMLFVSVVSTILATISFYFLVKNFRLTAQPLWLSLVFLVLPARWLIVHSVGSSEPLFIFFIILALYFFMKFEQTKSWGNIHLSAFFGLLAQLTRPPGVLLFIGLGLFILYSVLKDKTSSENIFKKFWRFHPLILIPLGLLGIFYWFSLSYHDFFAYFHSGDNIHLTFPPFQVFNKNQFWVGDIWLEDIIYTFILGLLGGLLLLKQKLYPLAFFVLTYIGASMLVAHRDISRYILPIFPFILIAYEKILTSKEFKIVLAIILLAVYLYSQNFILQNTAPIPNLEIFN